MHSTSSNLLRSRAPPAGHHRGRGRSKAFCACQQSPLRPSGCMAAALRKSESAGPDAVSLGTRARAALRKMSTRSSLRAPGQSANVVAMQHEGDSPLISAPHRVGSVIFRKVPCELLESRASKNAPSASSPTAWRMTSFQAYDWTSRASSAQSAVASRCNSASPSASDFSAPAQRLGGPNSTSALSTRCAANSGNADGTASSSNPSTSTCTATVWGPKRQERRCARATRERAAPSRS